MDLLSDLTPAQREAVTHTEGALLVIAGPGSGKTCVITRRVAHMLLRGIDASEILALTFTNKAAAEMRQRVESLVPGSGVWMGTFHALCARLLRTLAPLVGIGANFTIYDQADRLRTIKRVMESLALDACGVTPEQVEAQISRAKNELIGPEQFRNQGRQDHISTIVERVYPEYEARMRTQSAVDFDDLLNHSVAVLRHHPEVRARLDARYRYLLVDEYQDTNLAQYALVRALSIDYPNVCVTGDPDQSIYGWRGANLRNILEFERDFPGCRVVKLERNYRSSGNILRAADALIRHNRERKAKQLITTRDDGDPVELIIYDDETSEAEGVARRIRELVSEGEHSFRDCAVFVRTSALTRPIENAFRAFEIPYQVVGGVSFYERQEIKDLIAYLSLALNPKADVAFERVVNTPPRGIGAVTLAKLTQEARRTGQPLLACARQATCAGLNEKSVRALREFAALIDQIAPLKDRPPSTMLACILASTGYEAHLKAAGAGGEDRLANVAELITAAKQFEASAPDATAADFLQEVSLATSVDRWNEEQGAVAVMTLHAAKGLEFPNVFLIGLEENILPHARSQSSKKELEEERRLLFVGITRAQKLLVLSHARTRAFRGSRGYTMPSSFLRELPPAAMREVESTCSENDLGRSSSARWHVSAPGAAPSRLMTAADLAAGAPAQETRAGLDALRAGVTVLHPEFGLGTIVAVEGAGPERKGRIRFAVGKERIFKLAHTPLRLVGERTPPG